MTHINYELECGDVQVAIDMDAILPVMMCVTHKARSRVVAIECREWYLKCESQGTLRKCAFAGWFDQDNDAAIRKGEAHHANTGHPVQIIDYRIRPQKKDHVRKFFPRAVKTVIIPRERSNKIEGATRNQPKPQTLPDITTHERIPF